MRYVILRDDDTNALTPVDCLERLYRPFMDRQLPVNLAVIPEVCTTVTTPEGRLEGYLLGKNGTRSEYVSMADHKTVTRYLLSQPGYHVAQHGLHHHAFEFDKRNRSCICNRLEQGTQTLLRAGFPKPKTFIAPYDRLSRQSLQAVARRFPLLSTGWFELKRLPPAWWPNYFLKKISRRPHWRVGSTLLLTHPGCLLSYHRPYQTMLQQVKETIQSRQLTVLVTHWWEYFRNGCADDPFIAILHEVADYLSTQPDIQVISFDDLAEGKIPLS